MPTEFTYLVPEGYGAARVRDPQDTVQSCYKWNDLVTRPVIRDEYRSKYLVFTSRDDFAEWYEAVPAREKCMHEVIFGKHNQKLKFDIDAPAHKLDALSDSVLQAQRVVQPQTPEDVDAYLADLLGETPPDTYLGEPEVDEVDAYLAAVADETAAAAPPVTVVTIEESRLAKIEAIVDLLLEAILDELYTAYYGVEDLCPTREDLIVTDSSGAAGGSWKYSYHVIARYHVADNEEAKEFTERVLERLPPPVRAFVDPGVNKRTQSFRLPGSMKPGTGRVKLATAEAARRFGTAAGATLADMFIAAPAGARVLARVYTDPEQQARAPAPVLSADSPVVRAALELAARAGVLDGHEFREARGTLLFFTRAAPSLCRICCEVHHRDNSLILGVEPDADAWPAAGPVACRVVEHCRQAPKRGRTIGEVAVAAADLAGAALTGARPRRGKAAVAAADAAAPVAAERIARCLAAVQAGRLNPHDALASRFEQLPAAQKTVYAEPAMRPYELAPTLAVLAQMKLGKTKATRAFLDEHFPADGLETKVIRFVTFRQTFSRSIAESFRDFVVYSDVQGDLDHVRHPRLIVQVESLHRLRMATRPEPVDLLILDEAESIFGQFSSGLHKHFAATFAMFQWMMRTARHVLLMDANLGDRSCAVLERMRPAHPPHFHWNRFQRAADDAYFFTSDQSAWLGRLHDALRAGKRVVLPANSLGEARAFEDRLRAVFPAKRVMLYSSETAPSEKARHFADVHTHWSELDVLIYTPTCSAGVSYELAHFDVLFGYFCDVSCDVETCRQMLGRVRNLGDREHYICLRAAGAALPATVADLRRLVYDKRAGLYRGVEDAALAFEYEPEGGVRYYESDYFHLWLETKRVENLSRNDFVARFICQVADTGARVGMLEPGDGAAGAALLTDHRSAKTELKAARDEAVADSADLSDAEAAAVREALAAQQDVEPARRLAYEKWQLRAAFDWQGRPLDAAFVGQYNTPDARRVYRNLCRIAEGATPLDSLRAMREREAAHYDWTVAAPRAVPGGAGNSAAESRDLLRDRAIYVSRAHHIAMWLLHVAGFVSILDKRRIHEQALEARLRSALPALQRAVERIVFEFELQRPGLDRLRREADRARFLTGMLAFFNAALRHMYGLQIARAVKRAGGVSFHLNQNSVGKLFVFAAAPEPDDAPGGPRPHIVSNLAVIDTNRVDVFLEEVFYSGAAPGGDGDGAPPADDGPAAARPAHMPATTHTPCIYRFSIDDVFA